MNGPTPTKIIHVCPDEVDLIILAIRHLKTTNEGRKHAGRLNWLDSKFCDCTDENCQVWPAS